MGKVSEAGAQGPTSQHGDQGTPEMTTSSRSSEPAELKSGFVALVGRPNVGKSTLLNQMLKGKVSITSRSPNTTRTQVRGILERPGVQAIIVDTPGIHKPRSALGHRLNSAANDAIDDVDVTILVVDATAPIGRGDQFIASRLAQGSLVAVNKIDVASPGAVLEQLRSAAQNLGIKDADYFPISARTGRGVDALVEEVIGRLGPGPRYYPEGTLSDVPEPVFVAELVREQLLRFAREELPHSIACRVTEWDWPYIRCEILVERESQKGMVVGKSGSVLKAVGTTVRACLPEGAYLDLVVSLEKDWQRHPEVIERLGY